MPVLARRAAALVGPVALFVLVPAAAAQQQTLATFTFSDLRSGYNDGVQVFRAVSSDTGALQTSGDVTRLRAPGGTASYGPGVDPGLVLIEIGVTNLTATSAEGSGMFRILDHDGDVLRGHVEGVWTTLGAGTIFFNGLLSGVEFVDHGPLDGLFNGPAGGAFPMHFDAPPPYTGAFVNLVVNQSGFFTSSFENVSSQTSGVIVPAPASAAVLAVAGLAARRRRR